ncbi:MAG: FAD-binding oxidoreductase, partial [Phycisphaerae bacterium]
MAKRSAAMPSVGHATRCVGIINPGTRGMYEKSELISHEMEINSATKGVLDALNASTAFACEVRADRLSRALYATDASLYQIVPDAVVLPRRPSDVAETVRACGRFGVPLTARGAGTGLTGGAVNRGVHLDCSRHLNRILDIDVHGRTARVEPGVVLDEMNAALAPHGLHFAPDVAT